MDKSKPMSASAGGKRSLDALKSLQGRGPSRRNDDPNDCPFDDPSVDPSVIPFDERISDPFVTYRSIGDATAALGIALQALEDEVPRAHYGPGEREDNDSIRRSRHIWDRINHLQDAISHMRAKSAEDAVMQVCMAFAALDDLAHPELITGTDKEDPEWVRERVRRNVDRLLYSVVGFLNKAHGIKRHDVVEYFMSETLNPWR